MACPYCFRDFDYWDNYCYSDCPYSYKCEEKYYNYYNYYYNNWYDDDDDDYWFW